MCLSLCQNDTSLNKSISQREFYMNFAIIAYNHPESSLVLAKHLAKSNQVHYYYITDIKKKSIPGIGYLSDKNFRIGLNDITLKKDHPLYAYLADTKLKITVIAYPTFRPKLAWANQLLTSFFLRKIKKSNYDAINLIGQQELILSFYKGLKNSKVIHTLHEVAKHYKEQSLPNRLIEYLYTNHVPIIVHSSASYDRLMEQYSFKKNSVTCIPFGLFETYPYFSPGNIKQDNKAVLFYGFLRPYKGLSTFIKAIKFASEQIPDIKGIIAGGGYDEALSAIENDQRFTIVNRHLDNDEIASLNQQATLVVCPYTSASQSGIVMTSYLFDKPIIASDIGGFREAIIDGHTGYLVEVNNHIEIGNYIVKLLTDSDILTNMQENIKVTYTKGDFNWTQIADKTTEFYKMKKS